MLFTGNTVNGAYDNGSIEVLSLKTRQWKGVQSGGYFGRYLPTSNGAGHLLYLHQGTLFAVGFDLDRLEVRGLPAPLLEDVAGNGTTGAGQYDVARNGTLVYLSGRSSKCKRAGRLDGQLREDATLASRARPVLHSALLARWRAAGADRRIREGQ